MELLSLILTTTAPDDPAPWWGSALIGLVGVLGGILAKWLIDLIATRNLNAREDRLRFIHDRQVAYAELQATCSEIADVFHESRELTLQGRALDAISDRTNDDIDAYNADVSANNARRLTAFQNLNRAFAIVDMIAPESVVAAAKVLVSRAHHPHNLGSRLAAESAYIDAVRDDLGYGKTSHLPAIPFEPAIDADHPDSGVTIKPFSSNESQGDAN